MSNRRSSRRASTPAAAIPEQAAPAPRGRKRKNSDIEVSQEESVQVADNIPEEHPSAAPKRHRGAASKTTTEQPVPKRGRGRANSAASSVASEAGPNTAASPSQPAPKRGRGRANSAASSVEVSPTLVDVKAPLESSPSVAVEAKEDEPTISTLPTTPAVLSSTVKAMPDDDFDESYIAQAPKVGALASVRCPYLDTVCRPLLDFDMAKTCSITLSDQNVYACLVCGKFFQGRGKSTPLYTHSVQFGHFVVMSLHTGKAYCLPDGYEIGAGASPALVADARSLADVQRCLRPSFTREELKYLSGHNTTLARDVHGVSYLPGFVGLNNLSHTDYVSVVLHALSHVTPIRDFFLIPENYSESKSALVHKFGEVMRKMWSSHNFKSVVSPQEFLQQVSVSSKKRFSIGKQQEVIEFLVWLLNELHRGIGGTHKPNSSVIYRALQGVVQVSSFTKKKVKQPTKSAPEGDTDAMEIDQEVVDTSSSATPVWEQSESTSPFLYLSLDIPPTPLFKDSQGGLVIPQIPLFEVLKKFDGETLSDITTATGLVRRRYTLKKLPRYLILQLVRFKKNNFYVEKNPSIVTFPVNNLDMKPYLNTDTAKPNLESAVNRDRVIELGISELRAAVEKNLHSVRCNYSSLVNRVNSLSLQLQRCVDREELNKIALESIELVDMTSSLFSKYNLLSNICHDSLASQGTDIGSDQKSIASGPTSAENVLTQGSYRCHVQNKATGQWFEMQDLHVTETMPQLIGLSESYLLIYERKDAILEEE